MNEPAQSPTEVADEETRLRQNPDTADRSLLDLSREESDLFESLFQASHSGEDRNARVWELKRSTIRLEDKEKLFLRSLVRK